MHTIKVITKILVWCAEVFHSLKALIKEMGDVAAVGDEGGFAPNKLTSDEEAIEKILEAIKAAGFEPGKDFMIAMDAAASERVEKYNQLLRIEEELGDAACYPKMAAFNVRKA